MPKETYQKKKDKEIYKQFAKIHLYKHFCKKFWIKNFNKTKEIHEGVVEEIYWKKSN